MKKISKILASFLLVCGLVSCSNDKQNSSNVTTSSNVVEEENIIRGVIEVEEYGNMEFELYPDIAPITVSNFVNLAYNQIYDGLIFHRVIDNFMIQGGYINTNFEYYDIPTIKGEFASNGWENNLHHEKGVLSMARTSVSKDSASSQFFICYDNCDHLDGEYAAFGKLTSGYDVLEKIVKVETTQQYQAYGLGDFPVEFVVIKTIKIYD